MSITIGSDADRALDVATKGRTGKARPGFHLAIGVRRTTTAAGTPASVPAGQRRCTCATNGNHGEIVR